MLSRGGSPWARIHLKFTGEVMLRTLPDLILSSSDPCNKPSHLVCRLRSQGCFTPIHPDTSTLSQFTTGEHDQPGVRVQRAGAEYKLEARNYVGSPSSPRRGFPMRDTGPDASSRRSPNCGPGHTPSTAASNRPSGLMRGRILLARPDLRWKRPARATGLPLHHR